jgi:recombination protein RecA
MPRGRKKQEAAVTVEDDGIALSKEKVTRGKKKKDSSQDEVGDLSRDAMILTILGSIKKEYGAEVVRMANDDQAINERRVKLNVISTGSINFDKLTGVGGLAAGRIFEIRGKEGMFKTGILLCLAAQAQKHGYMILFVDAEHRLDIDRAEMLGVNVKDPTKFVLGTPKNGEQAFSFVEKIIKTIDKVFVIIDSVSALLPSSDLKKNMDDGFGQMGAQARLISNALKRLTSFISKSDSIMAFTNQYRTQMAGMFAYTGASGGKALPYYNTYILSVHWPHEPDKIIKNDQGEQIGQFVELRMEKNSTDFPARSRLVPIHLANGFWKELELLSIGLELGIVVRNGAWYTMVEFNKDGSINVNPETDEPIFINIGQGRDGAIEYLKENVDIANLLEMFIRKSFNLYIGDEVQNG